MLFYINDIKNHILNIVSFIIFSKIYSTSAINIFMIYWILMILIVVRNSYKPIYVDKLERVLLYYILKYDNEDFLSIREI